MSHDHDDAPPYSQLYINAWTLLAASFAAALFLVFCFNQPITHFFHWVWDLVRWIARPII
jgi:hypothetical protein